MKTTRSMLLTALTALAVWRVASSDLLAQAPPAPPAFWDALSTHGTWRNEPAFGWYWRPFEADRTSGWRPYLSGGFWQWSGAAWHWTSDYVWGATVFHFGRWANVPSRGWIWFPGEEFSPAWVHWVRAEGSWGWAPLPPTPGSAPGFALELQLRPEDFVFVAESQLSRRNLDTVAVAGAAPVSPMVANVPAVVPQWAAVPAPVYIPAPVYYYEEPPLVIHQGTRLYGAASWFSGPVCGVCSTRHGGTCGRREDPWRHGSGGDHRSRGDYRGGSSAGGWSGPRVVPTPRHVEPPRTAPPTRQVPKSSGLGLATPPTSYPDPTVRGGTPAPSKRALGVQQILNGRR